MRLDPHLALAGLIFAVACGDNAAQNSKSPNNATTGVDEVTYYQSVKPILDAHCAQCHREGGIGPFALTTLDEVSAVAAQVKAAVTSRQMPPVPAAPAVRPFRFDRSLDEAQIDLIAAWVDAGTPAGDEANPGAPIVLDPRELSRVDLTLGMRAPYTPTKSPDEYRCFVIEWPETTPTYVTGFTVLPGNLQVAHHAAIYFAGPDFAHLVDAADGADGSDGYDCFGGPTPPDTDQFPSQILGGWAPGAEGGDFPTGSGTLVEPGTRVILQLHYSTLDEGAVPDQTEVQFRLADEVDKFAGFLPFFDVQWINERETMLIPAGASDVVHEYVANPGDWPLLGQFVPGIDPSEGLMVHGAFPHLHKLGTKIWLQLERADGSEERLIQIDRWDFDWQLSYDFVEPVFVGPDDVLRLHCEWDNSMANQPVISGERRAPADVTFGEGTYDEMCVVPIYVTAVADGTSDCAAHGSFPADVGRFSVTFDASSVASNPNLDGDLHGPIAGSIYRAEDVTLMGPKDGTTSVADFDFEDVDLRSGPAGPYLIDVDLPAGDYQFLGYMDTDDNAEESGGPDLNDPIMIPARATTLACAEQPVTVTFPILLPNF